MGQLPLKLSVPEQYSLSYFVPHSGISEAIEVFERCAYDLMKDRSLFRLVFLYGPIGAGKTHLLKGYLKKAAEQGIPEELLQPFNLDELKDLEGVRRFIDAVESARSNGGLIAVEGEVLPSGEGDLDPHVRSRLLSGYSVRVRYPMETELHPLLLSILERRNLRIPEHSLQYLLRWLPANPLSLTRIIQAVDELALGERRRISPELFRDVIRGS